MREILFRGFHPSADGKETIFLDGKEIKGEWVEGDIVHGVAEQKGMAFIWSEKADNPFGCVERDVIPETVGQFTGMYDSTKWEELTSDEQALFLYPLEGGTRSKDDWKGKKIFEGDILDTPDRIVVVTWLDSNAQFDCDFLKYAHDIEIENFKGIFPRDFYKYKVIGDIFSNPELLNKN